MIKAKNISFSYTSESIYHPSSFTISDNSKVGLAGRNGTGKSTLLRIISGKEQIDGGKLTIQGSVSYVPQEIKTDQYLYSALKEIDLGELSLEQKPIALSGGQKTKLALMRALIEEPDILLLDEPTNFMDTKGKRWIMEFLSRYPKSFILVSHDLDVIDRHIDKVIAINEFTKQIEEYNGNYSHYLVLRKLHEERLKREIITEQRRLKHMKKGLERMQRYTSEKGVRRRTQLKKRIQRIEDSLPELPRELSIIKFNLPEPIWTGELPVLVKNISKSYGDIAVIDNLSFSIRRGERVALIGQNGAGKSTLIKMLAGVMPPDRGLVDIDEKVKIGYYSQEFETFDMEKTLLEFAIQMTKKSEYMVRPLLARFLFPSNKINQKIKLLSGGEKTRYAVALILLQGFNMLILDEPTTYLDVLSQRLILEAIRSYKGTLLVVSHTEDFIKELKPDKAILLPEENCIPWDDKYLRRVSEI